MKKVKLISIISVMLLSLTCFTELSADTDVPKNLSPVEAQIFKAELPPAGLVPSVVLQLGQGNVFSQYAFIVDKQRRTLTIWRMENKTLEFVEAHPIDYGKYEGDKQVSGDQKTPEGIYFFQKQLQGPGLNFDEYGSYAFTLDYPNHFDSLERKTGYGIWLHGIPDNKSLKRGSRGCVVVRDNIIKKLGRFINLEQTPIIVAEKVEYVTPQVMAERKATVDSWLNQWIASWQSKDIDSYMKNYSENFKSLKYNKKRWRRHKSNIAKRYDYINVSIKKPIILNYGNELVIRFIQDYRSDQLVDMGQKNLYVTWQKVENKLEIKGELWSKLKGELVALLQPKDEESETEKISQ